MWQKSSTNCTQVPEKTVKKLKQMWNSGLLAYKTSLCSHIAWEPTRTHVPLGMLQDNGERVRLPNHWGLFLQQQGLYCPFDKATPLGPNCLLSCARVSSAASLAWFMPMLSKVRLGPGQVQDMQSTAVVLVAQRRPKSKHALIPSRWNTGVGTCCGGRTWGRERVHSCRDACPTPKC